MTTDQMIADLILHGWVPTKAWRNGVVVFWLANPMDHSFKGAVATFIPKPITYDMRSVVIDVFIGAIITEYCDWDDVPEDLLQTLHVTPELSMSL
jgi:hypothetical protein